MSLLGIDKKKTWSWEGKEMGCTRESGWVDMAGETWSIFIVEMYETSKKEKYYLKNKVSF